MVHDTPDRGDVVWINLNPRVGHEQSGRRPGLVISPLSYNAKVGLVIVCPITTQIKRYPFEVIIPDGHSIQGAVLSDQVKSLDWKSRQASFICSLPDPIVDEVLKKLGLLLF